MMKVYRISKCEYINDLSGTGAARYPGRWNSKGTFLLYTAASASLALLESVVHIANIPILSYCMICLNVPEEKVAVFPKESLPSNWFKNPPEDILKKIGDQFVKQNKHLGIKIPSALIPEESNVLLNPAHPDFSKITVVYHRTMAFDERLFKK